MTWQDLSLPLKISLSTCSAIKEERLIKACGIFKIASNFGEKTPGSLLSIWLLTLWLCSLAGQDKCWPLLLDPKSNGHVLPVAWPVRGSLLKMFLIWFTGFCPSHERALKPRKFTLYRRWPNQHTKECNCQVAQRISPTLSVLVTSKVSPRNSYSFGESKYVIKEEKRDFCQF